MEENKNQNNEEQNVEETIIMSETIILKESASKEPSSTELDSISILFKKTWILYEKKLWKFAGITAIPLMSLLILAGTLLILPMFFSLIVSTVIAIALIFMLVIISVWSKSSLLLAISDSEEKIGIRESFKRSQKYVWHYFIISISLAFLFFGGLTLLFIPAIIFSIMTIFSNFVLINEDTKEINALVKSREYIRGYWWSVFGRILILGILMFILSTIPTIGMILFIFFATPFAMVYVFIMYKNLKEIKKNEVVSIKDSEDTKSMFILVTVVGIFMALFYIRFLGQLPNNSYANKNQRIMHQRSSFDRYDDMSYREIKMKQFKKDRF